MRTVVIVDIDHVISHAAPRDQLIGVVDWDTYHAAAKDDVLCTDIQRLVNTLHLDEELFIVGMTARPEKWRKATNEYLLRNQVLLDALIMREDDNYSPSGELKVELARKHFGDDFAEKILFVIDDNEHVISAFKAVGVTCLQCFGREYKVR